MTRWLRDPLWIFIAIGVVLFWVDAQSSGDDLRIEVSSDDIQRLTAQWQAQTGRAPSEQELSGLVDQFVEEEVYYREALNYNCLLYTSPSPRDQRGSRMPSSA